MIKTSWTYSSNKPVLSLELLQHGGELELPLGQLLLLRLKLLGLDLQCAHLETKVLDSALAKKPNSNPCTGVWPNSFQGCVPRTKVDT